MIFKVPRVVLESVKLVHTHVDAFPFGKLEDDNQHINSKRFQSHSRTPRLDEILSLGLCGS